MLDIEVQLDVKMDPTINDRDQRSPLPYRTLGELLATLRSDQRYMLMTLVQARHPVKQ